MAKDNKKVKQTTTQKEIKVELNMDKFLGNLNKDALISRLDTAKDKANKFDGKSMVDVLFSSKNGMYNASTVLTDFGIDINEKTNEELQDVFKGYLKDIEMKFIEFVKTFYDLDEYTLMIQDGDFTKGDIVIYIDKVR